jgi:hypothetical protein
MVAYISLFFLVPSVGFQQWLKNEASQRTGQTINLSSLRLRFPFRIVASGVEISNEAGNLLQGERISVTFGFSDLFSKTIQRIELHKPVFHVNLQRLFDSSPRTSPDIAIRHLNIEGGTVFLKTMEGQILEFRAINLDAQNFNMGQASGMTLQTELPWLNGFAEISIQSEKLAHEAEIKVRQRQAKNPPRLLSHPASLADALLVKIKLQKTHSQTWAIAASGQVNGLAIGAEKINGRFESRADIDTGFKNAVVSAQIKAIDLPSQIGSITIPAIPGGAVATFDANYSFPDNAMTFKTFHLASASGTVDAKGIMVFDPEPALVQTQANIRKIPMETIMTFLPEPLRRWTVRGSADADVQVEGSWRAFALKGLARTHAAELKSEMFSVQQLNLTAPFEWANSTLRANDVRILGKTLTLTSGNLTAAADEIRLEGGLEFKRSEPLKTNGKIHLRRGRYATSDGSKMGENFALAGDLAVSTIENKSVSLSGSLKIEAGELLWSKFFGDVKAQQPTFGFEGNYVLGQDELQLRRLDVSLAKVGTVGLSGTVQQISAKPIARLQVNGKDIQPSGLFEFFIRETLSRSYPILNQLTLGGRVDLAAQAYGALDDLSVEGNLQVQRASLGVKSDQWQLGPMNLTIPFRVHTPGSTLPAIPASTPTGTLAVESLRFGTESVAAFKIPVSLWNNALRFDQPIRVPLYGGTLELRNLTWVDLIGDPSTVSLSVEAKGLELQRLTEALGWHRFSGTLSGSILKAEMIGNVLRSNGQIQIELFGGHVQVSKTEIENPFSSLPALKLDAWFQDIDLERASETFAFGRISGILEGTLSDLIIANGQLSQMRADIRTVARPGISQWISVEALDKITVLSSGEDGSSVYGGIAGFIDEFRYSKMGFKAVLKNDKLTLHGIESSDGKEFLVVGSLLPPTVNVISHTQAIGFSELLKRLDQIKQSDKPQIK